MNDDTPLIHSPLDRTYSVGDQSVEIHIYRLPDTGWTLEVVDMHGNSTVWDDEFPTDQAALDEALRTIGDEGIGSLIGPPSGSFDDTPPDAASSMTSLAMPLAEDEMDELDAFLCSDAVSDETMMLDTLDGYLTAIVIGPTTLGMSQWYRWIWGSREEDAPYFESAEEARRVMTLIMRHYNGIIGSIGHDPETHVPLFDTFVMEDDDSREYIDGEMWAYGFMQGLELCRKDWRSLLDEPRGHEWLEPIRLLGADDITEEDEALRRTPAQREEIAMRIPASVAAIYRYWLPYRQALHELEPTRTYQREHPKIGRNDPCPCGSGKKFKKCCGMTPTLH